MQFKAMAVTPSIVDSVGKILSKKYRDVLAGLLDTDGNPITISTQASIMSSINQNIAA